MREIEHHLPPRLGRVAAGFRAAFAFLVLAVSSAAYADTAVVVGVQEYAPLISASTLRGCINDATAVKDILEKKNGFTVIFLTNEKATKAAILQALADCSKKVKKDERFVFYFAGHGRRTPHPALMPHDATSMGNDITTDDLNIALLKIPAKSRTVILDACFSGGMAAGEMARGVDDELTARFWSPPDEQERSLNFGPPKTPANNQDSNAKLENGSGICYYTACTSNEQALEGTFDGQRHGLFTFGLMNNLQDDSKPWGDVHNGVKTQMQAKLQNSGRQQNPTISKDFINAHALDNDVKKLVPPQPTKTLLDIWNYDNPDPKKVSIEIEPNDTVYEAGRRLRLNLNVGQEGYLVILGQVDGKYYQFFPYGKFNAEDAMVKPGRRIFPESKLDTLFFDEFGANQLKAILFSDATKAEKVMSAMRDVLGQAQIGNKDLVLTRSINEPEFTSRLSVAVSDRLLGGFRFKALEALMKKVGAHSDPVSARLWQLMAKAATYDKAKAWMADEDFQEIDLRDRQQFVTLFNRAIEEFDVFDKDAFGGVKLSKAAQDSLKKKLEGPELVKRNRLLLAQAYPDEIYSDDVKEAKPGA